MPRLDVCKRDYFEKTDKLVDLLADLQLLTPRHQKMVAELIMLRLFSLLADTIETVAAKLVCGATYLDGTSPRVLVLEKSMGAALRLMRTYGRKNHRRYLKWNNLRQIQGNVKYLLDPADNFFAIMGTHQTALEDMRCVRHHIAHKTPSTRRKYREVVKRHYGAYVNAVTPGILLLSSRKCPAPVPLVKYIKASRAIIKALVKG